MLCMTREKFEELRRKYKTVLILDDDVFEALDFVQELLEAEADATEQIAPHATRYIQNMNKAAYEVFSLYTEIAAEAFSPI